MGIDTYFEANTLDDLLREVFSRLLKCSEMTNASRGDFREILGATLVLNNPRARLSRTESKGKVFSALGELFWYLSGKNSLDFIDYYLSRYGKESDDKVTVRSGYGERLFSHHGQNQIENVISLLKDKRTSRRAVIQLFDASDLSEEFVSIPCTCTLQFMIRSEKLSLIVTMRSNDVYIGLPHDVFAFTMLQEIVARSLNVDIGKYIHFAGSLHLYEEHSDSVRKYINEGWQLPTAMDAMPEGDPWIDIAGVKQVEAKIRAGENVDISSLGLSPYWSDICRLFLAYRHHKIGKVDASKGQKGCLDVRREMSSATYNVFLDMKIDALSASGVEP